MIITKNPKLSRHLKIFNLPDKCFVSYDMALEDETKLVVKNVINKAFNYPVKDFPNRVMHDEAGKPITE